MQIKSLDDFAREYALPARATKEQLKSLGARYYRGESFYKEDRKFRIDLFFLEQNRKMLTWKRISPSEEDFTIHTRYPLDGGEEAVSYTSNSSNQPQSQLSNETYKEQSLQPLQL